MDSSVSLENQIWFLRVCHHVPFSLYETTELKHKLIIKCSNHGTSKRCDGGIGFFVITGLLTG